MSLSPWLTAAYCNSIVLAHDTRERDNPRAPGIHPSEITRCARELYYKRTLDDNEGLSIWNRVKQASTFEIGHTLHELFESAIVNNPAVTVVETEYNIKAGGMVGQLDQLLKTPDNELIVVDLKSINSLGFKKSKLPKPAHIIQINCYGYMLSCEGKYAPKYGGVVYINKDAFFCGKTEFPIKSFIWDFTDDDFNLIKAKVEMIKNKLNLNKLPSEDDQGYCNYCDYRVKCDKDSREGK